MKSLVSLMLVLIVISSCIKKEDKIIYNNALNERIAEPLDFESLIKGTTYLPLYSHIYHIHEHRSIDLAVTVSIRNISLSDSVYILKADYYNTNGIKIREYVQKPIYIRPMETIEIVISESDQEGGSGANFLFNWAMRKDANYPLFEAVMISTYGQQGISFTTKGIEIQN